MKYRKSPSGTENGTSAARMRLPRRAMLNHQEVEATFRNDTQFPPILSLDQAAKLAHLAPSTLKRLVSQRLLDKSVRRGKPVAFWRNRFVVEIMELDRARKRRRNSRAQKGGDTNETD